MDMKQVKKMVLMITGQAMDITQNVLRMIVFAWCAGYKVGYEAGWFAASTLGDR
jgi:hypothetical protein